MSLTSRYRNVCRMLMVILDIPILLFCIIVVISVKLSKWSGPSTKIFYLHPIFISVQIFGKFIKMGKENIKLWKIILERWYRKVILTALYTRVKLHRLAYQPHHGGGCTQPFSFKQVFLSVRGRLP